MFLSFESYPIWLNALIFLLSAGIIWFAGTRLERYANTISKRTGLGQAFIGLLLLAMATSLPEIATTVTAVVFLDNPTLAVHNLLGGAALQTGVLIAADRATRKKQGALTFFSPRFVLLIEGVGVLILLQLVIAGITAGGIPIFGTISMWTILLFLVYLGVMYLTHRYEGYARWRPVDSDDTHDEQHPEHGEAGNQDEKKSGDDKHRNDRQKNSRPKTKLWLLYAGTSLIVLVVGWSTAQSADVLAKQTGLGSAFLGATLLALATSLPELSTTITASRNSRYSMAISNIFGSNAFDISLLFLAELLYFGDTIIRHTKEGRSVLFVASVAALMTCIYLWGLMEREDRTIFGIGWDSAVNLLVYLGAMAVLYFIS